jgi:putative intracellular protease/amidase
MARILVLTGVAAEELDAMYPIFRLREGGFQTVAVAQHSQQCLDNTNLSTADGNQQQQFPCEGGDQQLWNLRPVSGVADTYTIVNQQTGKCLAVNGASTSDGAAVVQWTCKPANQNNPLNQTWRLWGH